MSSYPSTIKQYDEKSENSQCNKRICTRSPDEIQIDSKSQPDINNYLPPEILINIFSYLNECERFNSFKTCQHWRNIIKNSPQLWRWKRIVLNGIRGEVDQILQTLKEFGDYIEHLSIEIVENNDFRYRLSFRDTLIHFWERFISINNINKLKTLTLYGFGTFIDHLFFDNKIFFYGNILYPLCRFLKKQTELNHLTLSEFEFYCDGHNYVSVLNAASAIKGLKSLDIGELYERMFIIDNINYLICIPSSSSIREMLNRLNFLKINIKNFSKSILNAFTGLPEMESDLDGYKKPNDEKKVLELVIDVKHPVQYDQIDTTQVDWMNVKKSLSNFEVHLYVVNRCLRGYDFGIMLTPLMPISRFFYSVCLSHLSFNSRNTSNGIKMFEDTFRYIFQQFRSIEEITVSWGPKPEFNDDDIQLWKNFNTMRWNRIDSLVELVNNCRNLKKLTMSVIMTQKVVLALAAQSRQDYHDTPLLIITNGFNGAKMEKLQNKLAKINPNISITAQQLHSDMFCTT